MIKPSFISEVDWHCLESKYRGKRLEHIVKRIESDYPIQYAIGNVEFLDCKIDVTKSVLIPRFETELLADKLRKIINQCDLDKSNILDLCTGSGCIAISLKKAFPNCNVVGVDKSIKALLIAKRNSRKNDTKISFLKKDVLKNCKFKNRFSLIVANPPYVKNGEIVSPNTKFEPQMALYPGNDDIIFYKKILDLAKQVTYKKSIIAFEIGSTQAERICRYAASIFKGSRIEVQKDYNNFDRFIFIFNNFE